MKLKTPEEVVDKFGDIWIKELGGDATASGCPKFVRINRQIKQAITQDRQATLAAIREVVKGKEKDPRQAKLSGDEMWLHGYNKSLIDTLEAITKLLSSEV